MLECWNDEKEKEKKVETWNDDEEEERKKRISEKVREINKMRDNDESLSDQSIFV